MNSGNQFFWSFVEKGFETSGDFLKCENKLSHIFHTYPASYHLHTQNLQKIN